jgi:peptidoglycan/LPS O-acetylase OafA/YrhL
MTVKSAKFYIPSLDGIRAIAFLIVFISHAGLGNIVPGGLGVTIFFFLSGYLITTQLRREYDRSHKIDFKNFYMRRVLRIWPPFYLVLFLAICVSALATHQTGFTFQQLQAFSTQFFHISNYYNIEFGNQAMALGTEIYWSLAVEEHFYLFFPLLYVLLLRLGLQSKQQALIFWGICLVVLLWRCLLVFGMGADYDRIFYASDTRLDSIMFGCTLAVAGNPAIDQDQQFSERNLKYFLLPLGCTLLLCSLLYRSDAFRDTLRYSIQGIALYPIFIAAIRFPEWGVFRALNWGWIRFIGLLSYSLYLVHYMVIKVLALVLPGLGLLGAGILSLLISIAVAYAIHRFVEIPAAKLKQKFASP